MEILYCTSEASLILFEQPETTKCSDSDKKR